jgi:hypothetical protein
MCDGGVEESELKILDHHVRPWAILKDFGRVCADFAPDRT